MNNLTIELDKYLGWSTTILLGLFILTAYLGTPIMMVWVWGMMVGNIVGALLT